MTVIPEAPSLLAHAATGPAVVAVDPAVSAADVGGSFTVSVTVNNVDNLVGYDVILNFDPAIFQCTAATFPVILPNNFPVGGHNFCDNGTGSAEAAAASIGGSMLSVSSPTAVMVLTFKPLQATFATLSISLAQLAVLPGPTLAPVVTSDGEFGVPPALTFILPNATVAPGQRLGRISKGATGVTLVGTVMMSPSNVRAGFGGVTFDVIDPNGIDTPVQSNIAFGFPGDSLTVTASYTFDTSGFAIGTYHIVVTILRCNNVDPSTCINGPSVSGLFFKLKA
jgi:Cohesin domain